MTKKSKYILVLIALGVVLAILFAFSQSNDITDQHLAENTLEKVRVQAGWLLNGEFANVCSAIINGYYEEEGLDVELVPGGPTGANFVIATNAIALDDSLTLGIDGDLVPLIRGKDRVESDERLRVKAFGAFWNENPYGFMVRADSGIESIQDFANTKPDGSKIRIGVTADAVIQFAIADYIGVPVEELELITVGFDATPLLADQVDALAGFWTTQAYELEEAGIPYTFISTSELPGFDQPSMIAVATEKTLREKPETLQKWMSATLRGVEFIQQNPRTAAEHILDERCGGPTFDLEQETWLIEQSLPLFDAERPGWIYEEQVAGFARAYHDLGQIEREPDLSELVDYTILEETY